MSNTQAPGGETQDVVNKPKHYQAPFKTLNGYLIQALDVIVAWNLSFNLGNTIKYICRSGKKDPGKYIEDLKKARYYLDLEIKLLEDNHHAVDAVHIHRRYYQNIQKEGDHK